MLYYPTEMDRKRILERVASRETKERITVSVSKDVLDAFKRICADRPLSPVVEELMREFLSDEAGESAGKNNRHK